MGLKDLLGLNKKEQPLPKEVKPKAKRAPKKAKVAEVTEEVVVEDRSVFNCVSCLGEGLVHEPERLCSECNGTGKV